MKRHAALSGLVVLLACVTAWGEELAFPGAEGFGARSQGGRGGRVYFVSTLDDYDPGHGPREATKRIKTGEVIREAQPAVEAEKPIPGSLRQAIDADEPRIVVFHVAGTIALKAPLTIRHPFITIAGQSAPGGGICLRNYGLVVSDTHDVVVRYLRVRPGDTERTEVDGISIGGSRNVIVDHCSTSWAVDENLSVSGEGTTDVTVQWCFITESLNDSVHSKGPHGMGSLIRSDGDVTYHHNLYAMNSTRNPRPGTYGNPAGIRLDFRNNVIYNWGAGAGYSAKDPANINYIGNYIKPGPAVLHNRRLAFTIGGDTTRMYAEGNRLVDGDTVMTDDWAMMGDVLPVTRLDAPLPVRDIRTESAEGAYEAVLKHGGASKPQRDAVDARIVDCVRNNTGRIIDSQKDVGGWPDLTAGEAPADSDGDGMPDAWESAKGLDPMKADGATRLEEYLESLVATVAP
jgi:pectate lyase